MDNKNQFPFKIELLEMYARRWAEKCNDFATVESITLHNYSSPYAEVRHLQHPVKYCVVFDIGEEKPFEYPLQEAVERGGTDAELRMIQKKLYGKTSELHPLQAQLYEGANEHIAQLKSQKTTIYDFLECSETIKNRDSYLALMDARFADIYLNPPGADYKKEWIFFTRRLAEGNRGVMLDEPHIILYGAEPPGDLEKKRDESVEVNISGNYLKRCGQYWEISFDGKLTTVKDLAGIRYISYLLEPNRIGQSVSCLELYRLYNPNQNDAISDSQALAEGLHKSGGISEELTDESRDALGRQLRQLIAEKEKVDSDFERREFDEEIDVMMRKLKGLPEKKIDPNAKKAQSNVKKALTASFKNIKAGLPELSEHFNKHIVADGGYGLRYTASIAWLIIS